MKIFLSWSGDRSGHIAKALKVALRKANPAFEPWISSEDINRGSVGIREMLKELQESDTGIFVLTPENNRHPWPNFEAGAISKVGTTSGRTQSHVCTYLVDLPYSQLQYCPLANFQYSPATRQGTLGMFQTLNDLLESKSLTPPKLRKNFGDCWPLLEKAISSAPIEKRSGITHHSDLPRQLIQALIPKAQKRIWILDSWLARTEVFPQPTRATRSTANKNVSVKVLVLGGKDGDAILAHRLKELGKPNANNFSDQELASIQSRSAAYGWKAQIRTFSTLPPFNLIVIDNQMFIGLYWHKQTSSNGPFIEVVDQNSRMFSEAEATFDSLYTSAKPHSLMRARRSR